MNARARWLGVSSMLTDAVEHASIAIEKIQLETARRPFAIIERIPALGGPAQLVHEVHDAIVTNTYTQIRFWNSTVHKLVQAALTEGSRAASTPDPK